MNAYTSSLLVLGAGGFLGLFLRPRTVGKLAACIVAIDVAGLAISIALSLGKLATLFGFALMVLPVGALLLWLGAVLVGLLHAKKTEPERHPD